MWIRSRRLQWTGHILRMGPERKVKQAVFEMFKAPTEGDLLMDVPAVSSWRQLNTIAADRDGWRDRVRAMRGQAGVAPIITTSTDADANTPTIKCEPKKQPPLTESEQAKRYRQRDEREMFLRLAKGRKVKRKKKKKAKAKPLTDKERQKFAREHYAQNHPDTTNTQDNVSWSPITIEGHHKQCTHTTCNHQQHQNKCTPCHANTNNNNQTISISPTNFSSMCTYIQNLTQNQKNLEKLLDS